MADDETPDTRSWLERMSLKRSDLKLVATPGVDKTFSSATICKFVARHYAGDFGSADGEMNECTIEDGGGSMMSCFVAEDKTGTSTAMWVITSVQFDKTFDVDVTTVLLPSEY